MPVRERKSSERPCAWRKGVDKKTAHISSEYTSFSSVWFVVKMNECFRHYNMTVWFVFSIVVIVVVIVINLFLDILPDFIK
jgi:hypothetical protein